MPSVGAPHADSSGRKPESMSATPDLERGAETAASAEPENVAPTELQDFLSREVALREKLRRQVVAYERQLAAHGELEQRQQELEARAASIEAAEATIAERIAAVEAGAPPSKAERIALEAERASIEAARAEFATEQERLAGL